MVTFDELKNMGVRGLDLVTVFCYLFEDYLKTIGMVG
jgi:hypothetical protein